MWPKPPSYEDELRRVLYVIANPCEHKWPDFVPSLIAFEPGPGRKPSSRREIHEAFAEFVGWGTDANSMRGIVAFVRTKLEERAGPWKAPGSRAVRDEVSIYMMMEGGLKRIATLRPTAGPLASEA